MKEKMINKKTLYTIFLIFPMIKFDVGATNYYLGYFLSESIDNFLVLWDFTSIAIIIYIYVYQILKKGLRFIQPYVIFAIVIACILSYSTKTHSTMSFYRIFRELGNSIAFLMLANLYNKKNILSFLQGVYYDITFLMIINSFSMYFFQPWYINETGSVYYLFGLDNAAFMISLAGFFSGFMYYLLKYGKLHIKFILIYMFISGAYFYTHAATGMVITVICTIFMLTYKNKIYNIFSYKIMLIICTSIFILIVINTTFINRFSQLLAILGKEINFNGRAHLWMVILVQIKEHIWLGYGIAKEIISNMFINGGLSWESSHAHNVILEYFLKGGIIGLTFFGLLWAIKIKEMKRIKPDKISTTFCVIIIIAFLTYMFDYRLTDISFWIYLIMLYELETFQDIYSSRIKLMASIGR